MTPEFDHAIILHDDLAAAGDALVRLGFRPTPPGYHGEALGTENLTVVLPDGQTYFEVLAVREPTERNADKREALDTRGRHPFGMAIKGDAHALHARFAERGAAEGLPFDFSRAVDLPGGPRDASFTIAGMTAGSLPGLYGFVCQHHTPAVVWREDFLDQPNGARGVVGLWGVANDPHRLAATWKDMLGVEVATAPEAMTARLGAATVHYMTPAAVAASLELAIAEDGVPRLFALEFAVADLTALRKLLRGNGVPFSNAGERIVVPDPGGLGSVVLFSAAA